MSKGTCVIHPDRPTVGRGMCSSCYVKDFHRRNPGKRAEYQATWRAQHPQCPIAGCTRPLTHRKVCDTHYQRERAGLTPDGTYAPQQCLECGQLFSPHRRHAKFCSVVCRNRVHYRRKATSGKGRSGKRTPDQNRAKKAARRSKTRAERVDTALVFARDKWRCQLCGGKVDEALSGVRPDAPSLDHIVPLSLGGEHTWTNVRLAHFGCNSRRGNRAPALAQSGAPPW